MPQNDKALFLERFHHITPGTVTAGKALVVDANKDLSSLRNLTLGGSLTVNNSTFPHIDFDNPNANAADEFIASLAFYGRDSGAATQLYSTMETYIKSATAGAEEGWIVWNVFDASGSFNPTIQIVGDEVLIGKPPSATHTPTRKLDIIDTNSTTSEVTTLLRLQHQSTGTPAAGIGMGIEFVQETAANNHETICKLDVAADNVGSGTETGSVFLSLMTAGAMPSNPQFTLQNNGPFIIKAAFPNISLRSDTADSLDDFIGSIDYQGKDSGGNVQLYLTIEGYVFDGTSGSEDGYFWFTTTSAGGTGAPVLRLQRDSTAGNTSIYIWDNDNGQMEQVSVGAANSGGAGFKVLRIPN